MNIRQMENPKRSQEVCNTSPIYYLMLCPSSKKMTLCHVWYQQAHLPDNIHFSLALLVYCRHQVAKACGGLSVLAINSVWSLTQMIEIHTEMTAYQPACLHQDLGKLINLVSVN